MLAKIIVHGPSRMEALHGLRAALRECELSGLETNLSYLRQVCEHPALAAGGVTNIPSCVIFRITPKHDVAEPGTQTTIQDFAPGAWATGMLGAAVRAHGRAGISFGESFSWQRTAAPDLK